jgi:hypothetical protein
MAASDVSALIDLASPATSDQPVEQVEEVVEPTEGVEPDAEGEVDAPESGEVVAPEGDKPVDGRTNPAAIRSALKAFRDLDPKNAPIAKELNNAYGRYTAYREVFPKVEEARNAKALIDANGGHEGIASLQETIRAVNETDQLLYAGDPRVLDQLIEDFKSENKLDALDRKSVV